MSGTTTMPVPAGVARSSRRGPVGTAAYARNRFPSSAPRRAARPAAAPPPPARELLERGTAFGLEPPGLGHQPRPGTARVLDLHHRPRSAVRQPYALGRPEVGHPVGLELSDRVRHDARDEGPVEVLAIEAGDEVADRDRPPPRQA